MEIRIINVEELKPEMLLKFNRHQEVIQKWVKDKDEWVLKNVSEVREWSSEKKGHLMNAFGPCLENGGVFIGAFEDETLTGFVLLGEKLSGNFSKYINLSMFFVTKEKRAVGIGKKLFVFACEVATKLGADKLFIPAKDTMEFYSSMGCVDAEEIIEEFIDTTEDYYLEYKL